MEFEEKYSGFWQEIGRSRKMVLSTSLNDIVSSRMMSLVVLDEKFYFQTDRGFRKYGQIRSNPNVALCADNIQIEGKCEEMGRPADVPGFCGAYRECFEASFWRYTPLKNERVFAVDPLFIERWLYIGGLPYIERFDVKAQRYTLEEYTV